MTRIVARVGLPDSIDAEIYIQSTRGCARKGLDLPLYAYLVDSSTLPFVVSCSVAVPTVFQRGNQWEVGASTILMEVEESSDSGALGRKYLARAEEEEVPFVFGRPNSCQEFSFWLNRSFRAFFESVGEVVLQDWYETVHPRLGELQNWEPNHLLTGYGVSLQSRIAQVGFQEYDVVEEFREGFITRSRPLE